MNIRAWCLVCVMVTITACASRPPSLGTVRKALDQEPACCASPMQFEFEPFPTDRELRMPIGPGSKAYAFPSGKSFFRAFRVPDDKFGQTVEIATWPVVRGLITFDGAHILVPYFMFLDANKAVTRVGVKPALKSHYAFFENRDYWTGQVKLMDNERYLVVYTSPAMFDQALAGSVRQYRGSQPAGAGRTVRISASNQPQFSCGPAGDIQIRFVN